VEEGDVNPNSSKDISQVMIASVASLSVQSQVLDNVNSISQMHQYVQGQNAAMWDL
jgi:hypothetical protein